MSDYFCGSGHVFKSSKGGTGKYLLVEGMPRKLGGSAGYVLLRGIEPVKSDAVATQACLGGEKIIYNMGTAFGRVSITGAVLLGDAKQMSDSALSGLEAWFNKVRVSSSKRPVNVSVGKLGGGSKVFLISMSIGSPDPTLCIQPFAIEGVVAEPPRRQ